ncbi:hypothetical protein [Singulisphaera acidiphila]|uniref:Carboxymuconolactone decarboxylase-like domain-containing protein n=1 Tax=Singulisphaera acidiphila (strain ATCC BAA-1392 / DSM 18658 / VKM B-2454 / MOB10) TaxID=886293 RepID=L0DFQ8_SINAD|nr:hypothetical protein [Singulisphaera acidiphila]AGA27653.1 hypothetical protein Sinac_3392 [Singulisphaera acidiphila DSM 18658]
MFGWLVKRQINAFEKMYNYDMTYARVLLDADPAAFRKFAKVMGIARYRKDVPQDVWTAAKLVGAMAEDCGPCTQLVTTMSEHAGVPPRVLQAILERDFEAMPEDVALGFRFAEAALAHDPEADGLREQVVARWGKRGLVSLSFALTAARLFPTLKYALGEGKTCSRVTVGGKSLAVARHQVA